MLEEENRDRDRREEFLNCSSSRGIREVPEETRSGITGLEWNKEWKEGIFGILSSMVSHAC